MPNLNPIVGMLTSATIKDKQIWITFLKIFPKNMFTIKISRMFTGLNNWNNIELNIQN